MKSSDDQNLDVLQNIEFCIVDVYRADKSLTDFDAKDAIDALVRYYHAEEQEHRPPSIALGDRARIVFDAVQKSCEWQLGRAAYAGETEILQGIPVSELVACLRKIRKSIPFWSQRGGRQGYLDFVSQYIR